MRLPTREQLLHSLYEAAELEHDLMCTYLYAAFSIKTDPDDGISAEQVERSREWRRSIIRVAVEEMGHLAAVWNITSALGGSPRFGRDNFPIETGALPASVSARLAPFDEDALQHFLFLERPPCSNERDGAGFPHMPPRQRVAPLATLTPMPIEYETIGAFYTTLGDELRAFVEHHGEDASFCNDPALQLSTEDIHLAGIAPVLCSKTALAAFAFIVEQGEGAPADRDDSHYRAFRRIRDEMKEARRVDPALALAFPAARDPVLRPPVVQQRIWITAAEAVATVDLANASYALMLRMLAYAYQIPRGVPHKRLAVDLALGLMHALTPLAEHAVRLPVGPQHPGIHAGVTFTALRDAAPLPRGTSSWRIFGERLDELLDAASTLAARSKATRADRARRILADLAGRVRRIAPTSVAQVPAAPLAADAPPAPIRPVPARLPDGRTRTPGRSLAVVYDGKRCIHARFCVTGEPKVFHSNVAKGPWIFPDEGDPARVVEIVHACPSGALHYDRADGMAEPVPPVNLLTLRENGPYAIRADAQLAGESVGYRMTLCRCGASKNKPFCDNSHIAIGFTVSGEPASTKRTDPLPERGGTLSIEPEVDGPLEISGNLEIVSGTNRTIARVTRARLCRCGASATKPFCDNSHVRIGFRSDSPGSGEESRDSPRPPHATRIA